jgi:hypothetical protein
MSGRVGAVEGAKDVAPSTVSGEPSSDIGPASILSTMNWPLASYLELGALPSAVPSARLHARLVMAEWGFASLADAAELIVSGTRDECGQSLASAWPSASGVAGTGRE